MGSEMCIRDSLYREAPLASIWEGSGNVQCLDVLRAMVKSPASVEAFFAEVLEGAGAEPKLDAYVSSLRNEIPGWDSLGTLSLIAALDERFDIHLSEQDIEGMQNVNDIFEILRRHGALEG